LIMNKYFVYVLMSLKDGNLYIGQSSNLRDRFLAHQRGKVKSTKSRRPLVLAYWVEVKNREEAVKIEKEWKSTTGRRKLKKIIFQKMDLQVQMGSLPADKRQQSGRESRSRHKSKADL
jgi:putative endonuclease